MPLRRLVVLAGVTLALVVAAIVLVQLRGPVADATRTPLLAGLAGAGIDSVRIVGAGDRVLVTLQRDSGRFTVRERGRFPADGARIAALLDALGTLTSEEPKTRDPARHAALGVEDVARPEAQGLRIEIAGGSGRWALVVGHAAGQRVYVRLADDPQSHLAAPGLALERDPAAWLDRRLLDVKSARIAAIDVTPASGPGYRLERPQPDAAHFRFAALPRGRELYDPAIGDPQAVLLERFTIDDVAAAPAAAASTRVERARFTTYDGLTIDLEGRRDADRTLIAVTARAAAEASAAVRADAERITALAHGRWFVVGANRHDLLFKPLDNFLK